MLPGDFGVDLPSVRRLEQQVAELADQLSCATNRLAAAVEATSRADTQGWPGLQAVAGALTGDMGHVAWLRRAGEQIQEIATHIRVQRLNYQQGDDDAAARMNAVAEQLTQAEAR